MFLLNRTHFRWAARNTTNTMSLTSVKSFCSWRAEEQSTKGTRVVKVAINWNVIWNIEETVTVVITLEHQMSKRFTRGSVSWYDVHMILSKHYTRHGHIELETIKSEAIAMWEAFREQVLLLWSSSYFDIYFEGLYEVPHVQVILGSANTPCTCWNRWGLRQAEPSLAAATHEQGLLGNVGHRWAGCEPYRSYSWV